MAASTGYARIARVCCTAVAFYLILPVLVNCNFPAHATREAAEPGVPPPFEPVQVSSDAGGTGDYFVSVWGRQYHFERGPLPTTIVSQGTALLTKRPRFTVDIGQGAQDINWDPPSLLEQRADTVLLSSRGRIGALELTAETRIEYDGMIRVDLEFKATRKLRIRNYTYELAFPPEVAKSFNHHVPYNYALLSVDKRRMLTAAGDFPDASRHYRFVPTFFVGNRSVGLEWWSESDSHWKSPRGFHPLGLERRQEIAYFIVEPIASTMDLADGATWSDTFAIFPTPLRATPPNWRSTRFTTSWGRPSRLEEKHLRRAFIAFPGQFEARWFGLPASDGSTSQQSLREKLNKSRTLYLPYSALTVSPALHPESMKHVGDWAANKQLFTGPPGGMKKFLTTRNNWKTGQPYQYAACMGREDYLDWMYDLMMDTFRSEDLDGLYFDWASILSMCQKNPLLEGKPDRQVWEYFNVRRFYRRLYETMKAEKPDALLTIHTHGQPRALAAWADYTFIGEGWNVLFRDGHSFREIATDPGLYTPDYFRLPRDYLEAQLLPRLGGITVVLPEIHHGIDPKHPERAQRYQRALFAQVLPYDVPIWHVNSEPTVLESVFGAIDSFGQLDTADVYPWWERQGVIPSDDRLVVTTYSRDGRALLIVANWSEESITADLELQGDVLELRKGFRVRDGEDKKSASVLPTESSVPVTVPPHDLRILIAE